jgi:hypothetical protein
MQGSKNNYFLHFVANNPNPLYPPYPAYFQNKIIYTQQLGSLHTLTLLHQCILITASNGGRSPSAGSATQVTKWTRAEAKAKVNVMLRSTASRPVCPGVKHPSRTHGQIPITVRHLRAC